MKIARRSATVSALALTALLAACGTDGTADTSEATSTTAEAAAEATATGDGVTATVSPAEDIADGAEVTVTLEGLDPAFGGYYVAFCGERAEGAPAPSCTGDRATPGTQLWLSNRGGTSPLPADGVFTGTLTASASGEGVDCRADSCSLTVFGDHTEGFADVVSVPVTFAAP